MSFADNAYDGARLIGNVSVPLVSSPTIRSEKRRTNPDGTSSVPYYPGINGKKIDLEYTDPVLVVQTVSLTISSTGYAALITAINALDSTNIEAIDQDGFLTLRNKNPGKTHYLKILPQAVTVDEAAGLLGFAVDPLPGSISYAGELASAPGNRGQSNPQGTALLARDEDLTTEGVNRAFVSVIRSLSRLRADLERDVLVPREVTVTITTHPISGVTGFFLDDPDLRLPIKGLHLIGGISLGLLDGYFTLFSGTTAYDEHYSLGGKALVTRGHYDAGAAPIDTNNTFAVWGTPDGKVIHSLFVPTKEKHAAVAISSIQGNVVYCPGATFTTAYVQKNDPILVSGATNTSPFGHNGVFAVLDVIDDEHLSVRALGTNEGDWAAPLDGPRPTTLNATGSGFGNVTVYFGDFIPCSQMWFSVANPPANGAYQIRLMVGKPLRECATLPPNFRGHASTIVSLLNDHITDPSDAHAASAISGFTSATTWRDGNQIAGATLQATIEDILTDLKANTSGAASGARRVGAHAIGTGGNFNRTLAQGDVHTQLLELLTYVRDHEIDETAHDVVGVVSGFAQGPYNFPNLPVAGGTLVANYLGERRSFTVSGTSFGLAGNVIYYIYVDLADSTLKITQTQATAFSATTFPLYWLFTQGFGITYIHDFRLPLASSYNRSKGFVTVGPSGADFLTLEAAVAWVKLMRAGTGGVTARTWEIVVQGNITITNTIGLDYPVTIRGVSKDASGTPLCKIITPPGQFSGQTFAFNASSGGDHVTFKDLYFEVPSVTASINSKVVGVNFGHVPGDNWLFDNCIFAGGTNAPFIDVVPNSGSIKNWIFRDCWFKAANRTAAAPHIHLDEAIGFHFKSCRFEGSTADLFQQGIQISGVNGGGVDDIILEDCTFNMGGLHVLVEDGVDGTLLKNCRFRNSRGASIQMDSTGELFIEGAKFESCMTNSSTSAGVIHMDANSGRLYLSKSRFRNWGTGYALRIQTGKDHRVEDCVFSVFSMQQAVLSNAPGTLYSGNDFDLLPTASSGSGANIGVVLAVDAQSRVVNNRFKNCGSTGGAPDVVMSVTSDSIVAGNQFSNCRGTMISLTGNDNLVYGNSCEDCGTAVTDRGVEDFGQRNQIFRNHFQNLSEASQLIVGPMFRMHQNWAVVADLWSSQLNGGGAVLAILNPAANKPGYWMRLRTAATNDFAGKVSPGILQGPVAADIALCVEFYIDATAVAGTPTHYIQAGLCHDEGGFNGPTSTEDMIKLEKSSASANWRFKTGGATVTTVTTSIAATGVQHIRIELVGSSEPGGARAQLFIDGVLAASSTTTLPDNQVSPFSVVSVDQGVNAQRDVFISPVTIEYRKIP